MNFHELIKEKNQKKLELQRVEQKLSERLSEKKNHSRR